MEKYQFLFNQVREIVLIEQQKQKEKRDRGEYFNIFEVLKLTTNETRTHSAFIAELLNPQGSHGMKSAFLDLFLKETDTPFDFNSSSVKVEIEYPIGNINGDYSNGGRIDILISDNQKAIIIENKIYAGDQYRQLRRYYNYGQDQFKQNSRLLYLTLDGCEPSKDSADGLVAEKDFYCISYDEHISSWLQKCVSASYAIPLVRETIVQYINLINKLTKKSMDIVRREELISIMRKNADSVKAICSVIEEYENSLIKEFILDRIEKWAKDKGLEYGDKGNNILTRKANSGFFVSKKEWKEWYISVYTESANLKNFYIGISSRFDRTKEIQPKFDCFVGSPVNYWPYGWQSLYDEENNFRNWDYSLMPQIAKGAVADFIIEWIEKIQAEIEAKQIEM